MSAPPYFYGEKVITRTAVCYAAIDPETGYMLPQAPLIVPANVPGTFLKRIYRPVLGFVNLIRVHTDHWNGFCLLSDEEIEVVQ